MACLFFSTTYQVDRRTCIFLNENAFHVNEKNQIYKYANQLVIFFWPKFNDSVSLSIHKCDQSFAK